MTNTNGTPCYLHTLFIHDKCCQPVRDLVQLREELDLGPQHVLVGRPPADRRAAPTPGQATS